MMSTSIIATRATMPSLSSSSSCSTSIAKFESILCHTMNELQTRSEVEDVLQSLCIDIEQTEYLNNQLLLKKQQDEMSAATAIQSCAYKEALALEKEGNQYRASLADDFAHDIAILSNELSDLYSIKGKYDIMVVQYTQLKQRLIETENQLSSSSSSSSSLPQKQQKENNSAEQPQQQTTQSTTTTDSNVAISNVNNVSMQTTTIAHENNKLQNSSNIASADAKQQQQQQQQRKEEKSSNADGNKNKERVDSETTTPIAAAPNNEQHKTTTTDVASINNNNTATQVIEIDSDAAYTTPPNLEDIDMELLMRIFGFLDPYDILNTAQINISMYSRVDALFGFSMGADGAGGSDGAGAGATTSDQSVAASTITSVTPTVASTADPSSSSSQPIIVSMPPPSSAATKKQEEKAKPTATATMTKPATGGLFAGFGLLPIALTKGTGATGSTASNASTNKGDNNSGYGANIFLRSAIPQKNYKNDDEGNVVHQVIQQSKQPISSTTSSPSAATGPTPHFSKAMADSMASKLNNAEIQAILSMTQKLRRAESEALRLSNAAEELEGKLNGSEAVKGFLIKKLRALNEKVNLNTETEKKITQQITSDQEVIAFLDGRVQELETLSRNSLAQKADTIQEFNDYKKQTENKITILTDMLQFERDRHHSNEKEWKATRKVLVKEIKNCRSHIITLKAERSGYHEQNEILKKNIKS